MTQTITMIVMCYYKLYSTYMLTSWCSAKTITWLLLLLSRWFPGQEAADVTVLQGQCWCCFTAFYKCVFIYIYIYRLFFFPPFKVLSPSGEHRSDPSLQWGQHALWHSEYDNRDDNTRGSRWESLGFVCLWDASSKICLAYDVFEVNCQNTKMKTNLLISVYQSCMILVVSFSVAPNRSIAGIYRINCHERLFLFFLSTFSWFVFYCSQKHRTVPRPRQSDLPADPLGTYFHLWPTRSAETLLLSSSHEARRHRLETSDCDALVRSYTGRVFFFFSLSLFLLCCHAPTVLWQWFPGT